MNAPAYNPRVIPTLLGGGRQIENGFRQLILAEAVEGIGRAGDLVTLSVQPSDTSDQLAEIDTYLGGYSVFAFTADLVAPIAVVKKEKGKRRDFSKENAFEVVPTEVGRQGAINEIQHGSATTDYETMEHALACFIPWASESDAVEAYDVRAAHSRLLADKLLLSREVKVWNFVTTLNNWATTNRTSLTANFKWDNGSTKNPRKDLHDRIEASAQPVTGIFMNPTVGFWFLSDTEVRAYLKQMMGDNAPPADLARAADSQGYMKFELVGYPPIHICPAKKLSAGNLVYCLGDDVVLSSSPPSGVPIDGMTSASCLTFRHRGKSGTGWVTNEYIPQGRGLNGGRMLETGYGETVFMGSNIAGGLIKDVLST